MTKIGLRIAVYTLKKNKGDAVAENTNVVCLQIIASTKLIIFHTKELMLLMEITLHVQINCLLDVVYQEK